MKKSQFISLVALFASLNVVFDSLMGLPELSSGVWYSWIFIVEPITGIVLGPYAGFLSTLIGVMIGHCIHFRGLYEFIFTLGAPIGAMISGFLFRKEWKTVLSYFTALLAIYFFPPIGWQHPLWSMWGPSHRFAILYHSEPISWQLPLWGMWDTYLAYVILIVASIFIVKLKSWNLQSKELAHIVALCVFIGLEADVLFRIFVFIPCQTYKLFYDLGVETLRAIWIAGAVETPIKVALSIVVTTIIGPPLIKVLRKMNILSELS